MRENADEPLAAGREVDETRQRGRNRGMGGRVERHRARGGLAGARELVRACARSSAVSGRRAIGGNARSRDIAANELKQPSRVSLVRRGGSKWCQSDQITQLAPIAQRSQLRAA